jgi:hypothetical protein
MKPLRKLQGQDGRTHEPKGARGDKFLAALDSTLRELKQTEEGLGRSGPNRERHIWERILGYVNAELPTDAKAYEALFEALFALMPEFSAVRNTLGQYEFSRDDLASRTGQNLVISQALDQQQGLRKLLLWLCKPKSHPELRVEALRLLEAGAHGEHWWIDYGQDPVADFDPNFDEKTGHPLLYFVKQLEYTSIVSPICKFIFDYVDDPPKGLPIRVCERPGCSKFMLPQRAGRKEYCSVKCCSLANKKSPKEVRDYMFLYRLEKESKGVLQAKLKTPEVKSRLHQIESRWPNLCDKLKGIRERI